MDKKHHPDSEIIDRLGGTSAVARIFKIKGPSVSEWRNTGIPRVSRMYLQVTHPEAFVDTRKKLRRRSDVARAAVE